MTDVTVTQAMHKDAEALADLICGCATKSQHRADVQAIIGVLARHAAQARAEALAEGKLIGARLMQEAAKKGVSCPSDNPDWAKRVNLSRGDYVCAWEDGHADHNNYIRALDLAEVVKGGA
ncbi:hypothetical protein GTZ99_12565 [Novosphingobium sp. FSY-8]|uniref:Uncharacterized protein n=1 Tax=Novosphingobium ovatum TaxID=1908523 RepID=A0ABW9XFV9_9SPHN|nr:hypothetical protein [Novosphingobium ovatum]NBC37384.1 hypothetical protein [Novosphingobium ovatum]